jgi:glycosyltransferase involved in cell wall biosynthesis
MASVSVIIPTYNRAAMLGDALESVLAQTYQDFEVIVVDDGSTDHTSRVVDRYHRRVRYIRQENQGHAAAKNTGIATAGGRYIAFLDDDDVWLPRKLALQVDLLESNPDVGLVYAAGYRVEGGERTLICTEAPPFEPEGVVRRLLKGNFLAICSVLVRAQALNDAGAFDPAHGPCDDWDMWLRVASRGHRFGHVSQPVWEYRFHATNMMFDNARFNAGRISVLKQFFAAPELAVSVKSARKYYLTKHLVEAGMDYYNSQAFGHAFRVWREALSLDLAILSPSLVSLMMRSLAGARVLRWGRGLREVFRRASRIAA